MKKWFSILVALVLVAMQWQPANATLTNSSTFSRYSSGDLYSTLITAASNDTTATADSNVITNYDGAIKHISAGVKVTNQTGTSPTLTLQLIGSFTNTTNSWFVLQSKQGSTAGTTANIATSALDISSASTTNVATGFSTDQFNRAGGFPPYLKVRAVVGGSSTPGWTGVVYALVIHGVSGSVMAPFNNGNVLVLPNRIAFNNLKTAA